MDITERKNDEAIKKLKQGIDTSWDIFLYGDKKSGTKPGNIRVYGTIAGQKEVLKGRLALKEELSSNDNEM